MILKDFIKAIEDYRVENDLTQSELGRKINIKQQQISRMVSGDYDVRLGTVERVLKSIGKEIKII